MIYILFLEFGSNLPNVFVPKAQRAIRFGFHNLSWLVLAYSDLSQVYGIGNIQFGFIFGCWPIIFEVA